MILVRKASSDYWYDFENKTDVFKLIEKYNTFIFKLNYQYKEKVEDLIRFWDGLTLEDAKKISKCRYEILIYDDYIE